MQIVRLLIVLLILMPMLFVGMAGSASGQETTSSYTTFNYYDGYLWLENVTGETYATVHDAEDADYADYAGTYALVGQEWIAATDTFRIWRGALQFDTTGIPALATITNSTIMLYGHADNSAMDFYINITRGAELNSPIVISDYGALRNELGGRQADPAGWVSSADWQLNNYNAFVLNAAGIGDIVKGGVTKYGVRSEQDIDAVFPTGQEYVSFWTSERGYSYAPWLLVEYTLDDLGIPGEFFVAAPLVFSDCLEPNDQLYVFRYKVEYSWGTPDQLPYEYFYIQLLDNLGVIQAQDTLPAWGYQPGSLYLSNTTTVPWGVAGYQIRIISNPTKFSSVFSTVTTVQLGDWIGDNLGYLDSWVLAQASVLGNYYDEVYKESIGEVTKLTSIGGSVFLLGIPYLDSLRPDLFITTESDYDWGEQTEHDPAFQTSLQAHMGAPLTNAFNRFGNIFGISGQLVGAGLWLFLMVGVAGVITLKTKDFTGGAVCAAPLAFVGWYLGALEQVLLAVVCIIAALFLGRFFWLRYG